MKRIIALSSAAALALGLWTATPAAANPAVLIFAPAAMGGVSAGWAAAAGLGGVLFGTALGAAAANNGWYGNGGYAYPGYGNGGYAYHPGYGGGYAAPGYGGDASRGGYAYHPGYGSGGYASPGYGSGGYTANAPSGYGNAAYDGPVYADPASGGPVYGEPYAAPAPVSHCYRSHRWVNGYSVPVRVCVTPY
jgi:defect in organelle trafficking protein DotC